MNSILVGDCLRTLQTLPDASVHCCVTSPPYWGLRDYGHDGQIGQEQTPEAFVSALVAVFREVRRVLRDDGTCWVNLGDSYAGSGKGAWGSQEEADAARGKTKEVYIPTRETAPLAGHVPKGLKRKDLVGIPWRIAFALQADGWYLRQDIIWHKPNPMPESVTDRCTKSHEYLFLLTKSERYHYNAAAIAEAASGGRTAGNKRHKYVDAVESGMQEHRTKAGLLALSGVEWDTRNRRSVWTIPTQPFAGAHFAVMPEALVEPCILAGCPEGGTVLDPFCGSGTVPSVAARLGRRYIGCELNPDYAAMAERRIAADCGALFLAMQETP